MDAWTQFFVRAGIPNGVAGRYAKSFEENRITKEMLPELDKPTLAELGVTAIGDQLLILRRIKAAKSALSKGDDDGEAKPQRDRISAPGEVSYASELRKGKPPPDRHEIYHVKMPSGNTARTQKILEKAEKMRKLGLAVRGTTGVRQGGRSVSPIDKSSLPARLTKRDTEVSSSSDAKTNRSGLIGRITATSSKIQRISVSSIQKNVPQTSSSIRSRIVPSKQNNDSTIRVHLKPQRVTSNRTSREPIVLDNRRKPIHVRLQHVEKSEDDSEEYMEEEDEDDVRLEYDDGEEEEEMYDDDQDSVLQVGYQSSSASSSSSIHNRISYSRKTVPTHNRRATVIDQSDSVFSRVSFHR